QSLPGARLARRRALTARGARPAGPRPLPRARTPPGDRAKRALRGARRLAARARRPARDRVRRARGPDGEAAARGEARRDARGLRARRVRASPRRGVRRRAPRGARGGNAHALPHATSRLTVRLRTAALHLLVLWAFAVAQPLFDLLGKNGEFFAARG